MSRKAIALAAAAVIAVLAAGFGAYLIGHSGGEDLEEARSAGQAAGTERGTEEGTKAGLQEGLEQGRKQGFGTSFEDAYTSAYRREFRDAGLNSPVQIQIPRIEPSSGE